MVRLPGISPRADHQGGPVPRPVRPLLQGALPPGPRECQLRHRPRLRAQGQRRVRAAGRADEPGRQGLEVDALHLRRPGPDLPADPRPRQRRGDEGRVPVLVRDHLQGDRPDHPRPRHRHAAREGHRAGHLVPLAGLRQGHRHLGPAAARGRLGQGCLHLSAVHRGLGDAELRAVDGEPHGDILHVCRAQRRTRPVHLPADLCPHRRPADGPAAGHRTSRVAHRGQPVREPDHRDLRRPGGLLRRRQDHPRRDLCRREPRPAADPPRRAGKQWRLRHVVGGAA